MKKDLATIHVDQFSETTFIDNKIYPACIMKEGDSSDLRVHSGWSTPPPDSYLQKFAPLYVPSSKDFRKQWHYQMKKVVCKDPVFDDLENSPFTFSTDTYYPPGLGKGSFIIINSLRNIDGEYYVLIKPNQKNLDLM